MEAIKIKAITGYPLDDVRDKPKQNSHINLTWASDRYKNAFVLRAEPEVRQKIASVDDRRRWANIASEAIHDIVSFTEQFTLFKIHPESTYRIVGPRVL
ncbi:hypothetical protein F2P81_009234 [Scophthalmus maximus]|uniref:Uncharacterized protein n=1 Tax=Scophthalmus maximus TaxID=52904 RepID=A0A6A4T3Z7_SCOMX|nr:hypothetical protein F2P81_009234 [Scophthalmus maximus]